VVPKPGVYLLFGIASGIVAFFALRTGRFFIAATLLGAAFCFIVAAVNAARRSRGGRP
jgi:hypothetical protein